MSKIFGKEMSELLEKQQTLKELLEENKTMSIHKPLSEEILEILANHKTWLELLRREPREALTEEQMKLRGDLSYRSFPNCDFSYCDLSYMSLEDTSFRQCKFTSAKLRGVYAPKVDFYKSQMILTDIQDAYVKGSSFMSVNLTHSNLSHSNFDDCDFTNADLTGVKGRGTLLHDVKLENVYVKDTDFRYFHTSKDDWILYKTLSGLTSQSSAVYK